MREVGWDVVAVSNVADVVADVDIFVVAAADVVIIPDIVVVGDGAVSIIVDNKDSRDSNRIGGQDWLQ